MPIDPRKRQKKLERHKAKQKTERRELARRESGGLAARLVQASAAPILHCCTTAGIWDVGMGQVVVSRQLAGGQVAFVAFLVDMYFFGVKNVIVQVAPRPRYQRDLYDKLARRETLIELQPPCARKLVEGAVAYASNLGVPPYADYRVAKLIFGDIDAGACIEEYEYGKDGEPLFIAGPHDSPAKMAQVARAMAEHRAAEEQPRIEGEGPPALS
jgi:hypothetical protein